MKKKNKQSHSPKPEKLTYDNYLAVLGMMGKTPDTIQKEFHSLPGIAGLVACRNTKDYAMIIITPSEKNVMSTFAFNAPNAIFFLQFMLDFTEIVKECIEDNEWDDSEENVINSLIEALTEDIRDNFRVKIDK